LGCDGLGAVAPRSGTRSPSWGRRGLADGRSGSAARPESGSHSKQRLVDSFEQALPDFTDADVVGSPYCIGDYEAAEELGAGRAREARDQLKRRGLKLILDFVRTT